MEKEDINVLSQLLITMRDAAEKLEDAFKSKKDEKLAEAKREILEIQQRIERIL